MKDNNYYIVYNDYDRVIYVCNNKTLEHYLEYKNK